MSMYFTIEGKTREVCDTGGSQEAAQSWRGGYQCKTLNAFRSDRAKERLDVAKLRRVGAADLADEWTDLRYVVCHLMLDEDAEGGPATREIYCIDCPRWVL